MKLVFTSQNSLFTLRTTNVQAFPSGQNINESSIEVEIHVGHLAKAIRQSNLSERECQEFLSELLTQPPQLQPQPQPIPTEIPSAWRRESFPVPEQATNGVHSAPQPQPEESTVTLSPVEAAMLKSLNKKSRPIDPVLTVKNGSFEEPKENPDYEFAEELKNKKLITLENRDGHTYASITEEGKRAVLDLGG
jgi:hypothetical protein